MTTQTAYQCDANGVFVAITLVQEDPLHPETYLMPPGCTLVVPPQFDSATHMAVLASGTWTIEPIPPRAPGAEPTAAQVPTEANRPQVGDHQIAVIADGAWTVLPDYRGKVYWLGDGSQHTITEIGVEPPSDALSAPPAPPAPTLAEVQTAQVAALRNAYQAAIQKPVAFTTAGGHADTFAADSQSVANLEAMLAAYGKDQQFPMNLWLNGEGIPVSPFTYADLQGLAKAIADQATPDYQELLSKIAAVMAATSVAGAQAVVWS